jgi:hypothetical protein
MNALATILRNFVALFVDDGSLAAVALIWIALCGFALRTFAPVDGWAGPIFFLGLALILLASTMHAARPRR